MSFNPASSLFCATGALVLGPTWPVQYPPNVRIVRLMCNGGLDPVYVLKSVVEGADGVLIGGCHPGDCHYQSGNYRARRRFAILQSTLDMMGFEPERMWLRWISAGEGQYFADTVTEMVAFLKEKGPNSLKGVGAI